MSRKAVLLMNSRMTGYSDNASLAVHFTWTTFLLETDRFLEKTSARLESAVLHGHLHMATYSKNMPHGSLTPALDKASISWKLTIWKTPCTINACIQS